MSLLPSSPGHVPIAPDHGPGRWTSDGIFVWGVWGGLLLCFIAFVVHCNRRFPFCDEWDLIVRISGAEPLSLAWFWQPINEHRVPVPKLMFMAIYRLSGFDSRVPTVCSTILMGVLSAWCLLASRRLRGHLRETDAFFPVLILSFGHGLYFWAAYLQYVAVILSACTVLFAILGGVPRLSASGTAMAGLGLCLLPLNGGQSLAMAPPLVLWLFVSSLMEIHSGRQAGRRSGTVQLGVSVLAGVLVLLYFVGLRFGVEYTDTNLANSFKNSLIFFNTYYAGLTILWSPWLAVPIPLLAVLAAAGAAAGLRLDRGNRCRDLGMLCFGLAVALQALAIGRGRATHLWEAINNYSSLTIPGLCWLYFAVQLYFPRGAARLIQLGLLFLTCTQAGLHLNTVRWQYAYGGTADAAILRDLRAGVTPARLADRHIKDFANEFCGIDSAVRRRQIIVCLRALRDRGTWPYSLLEADRREEAAPAVPHDADLAPPARPREVDAGSARPVSEVDTASDHLDRPTDSWQDEGAPADDVPGTAPLAASLSRRSGPTSAPLRGRATLPCCCPPPR